MQDEHVNIVVAVINNTAACLEHDCTLAHSAQAAAQVTFA
jgi:hypothetical protein